MRCPIGLGLGSRIVDLIDNRLDLVHFPVELLVGRAALFVVLRDEVDEGGPNHGLLMLGVRAQQVSERSGWLGLDEVEVGLGAGSNDGREAG